MEQQGLKQRPMWASGLGGSSLTPHATAPAPVNECFALNFSFARHMAAP